MAGESIYVDGVLQTTTQYGSNTTITGSILNSLPVCIGADSGDPAAGFMNGTIDDARIYNRALSPTEVKQLYNLGTANIAHSNTVISNGLVGYWTFDGPSMDWRKNQVADASGNGKTGTLVSLGTTTAPTPGKIGQAMKFDGSSSYIVSPTMTGPIASEGTYSYWIKPATLSSDYSEVISIGRGSGGMGNVLSEVAVVPCWDRGLRFIPLLVARAAGAWAHGAADAAGVREALHQATEERCR